MTDQQQNYQWTEKLPALLAAIALAIVGILGWRKSVAFGVVCLIFSGGLFIYSNSIKEWCVPNEYKYGHLTWGKTQFHSPSFVDCLKLTGVWK